MVSQRQLNETLAEICEQVKCINSRSTKKRDGSSDQRGTDKWREDGITELQRRYWHPNVKYQFNGKKHQVEIIYEGRPYNTNTKKDD